MTDRLSQAREDLVSANRILANEGILDAFGHVSVRHPEDPNLFLLSRARSPEVIEDSDLLEHGLDGEPTVSGGPLPYLERFIHAAVYEARPEVVAVCHSHTPSILPFSVSLTTPLRAIVHSARFLGGEVPVWDIASEFGHKTNMLVINQDLGRSLNRAMGNGPIALMRGHGCVVASNDLQALVSNCISMDRNAKVQLAATALGDYTPIHTDEYSPVHDAALTERPWDAPRGDNRAWEYFRRRAGVS
jgi:ribulose-5-phosphate 4-epimerase/fuculose-1-phosphate aldolase